ncbi:helix-turn-helix domain-containing protein [Streptomyces sparsogenes]|uniref:winged helix-turn-helix transcriptional regulator n=1 Tax=Streptomyces sparsogenes TaxID=67365 RepID=UPI0033D131E5
MATTYLGGGSNLQRRLEGVSPKVLTSRLRRLEEKGFVDRTIYPAVPLHVEYALTDLGRSVAQPLGQLRLWVVDHIDEIDQERDSIVPSASYTSGG